LNVKIVPKIVGLYVSIYGKKQNVGIRQLLTAQLLQMSQRPGNTTLSDTEGMNETYLAIISCANNNKHQHTIIIAIIIIIICLQAHEVVT